MNKLPAKRKKALTAVKPKKRVVELMVRSRSIDIANKFWAYFKGFWWRHLLGTVVILIATFIFFWPIVTRISSYSEGGDAMFNAWTLARNHHCILQEGCPKYSDANIYFPHKDTMLYSETQISAGLLTLPIYLINHNPLVAYNILTIASFFLSGWFMYLLAKRLSKGNEIFSILAGLIFAFAPLKMASISHLQNLSIFYLPLAVMLMLKFFETKSKKYLVFLLVALSLQFYASWYQMVFVLIAIGVFLIDMLLFKLVKWRAAFAVGLVVILAVLTTLPLAKEYIRFSKANQATFSIQEQSTYSSSLADYVIPHNGTILGKLYYKVRPTAKVNSYNLDSYSYHGFVLYAVALLLLAVAYRRRKEKGSEQKTYKLLAIFILLSVVGFIMSLGPLLKLKGNATYADLSNGLKLAIPMPYLLIDKLLPQLSFIRAIGRASVLCLFALCSILAFTPVILHKDLLKKQYKLWGTVLICALVMFELMPVHRVGMVGNAYNYNLQVPTVYKIIKADKNIDNIVILNADKDYPNAPIPVARAEWVLWAGYHNKNIFNGYSGYTPPNYFSDYDDFVDFKEDDVPKLVAKNLHYVLVDKLLSSTNPLLLKNVSRILPDKIYEDQRYALFKI